MTHIVKGFVTSLNMLFFFSNVLQIALNPCIFNFVYKIFFHYLYAVTHAQKNVFFLKGPDKNLNFSSILTILSLKWFL